MKRIALVLFLVAICTFLHAQSPKNSSVSVKDGRELLEECSAAVNLANGGTARDIANASHCMSYVRGFADGYLLAATQGKLAKSNQICVPPSVSNEQLARVVKKWLEENPAKLHYAAAIDTALALEDGFPCK